MSATPKPPSGAQARLLARVWGGSDFVKVNLAYSNSTLRTCVERGWLEPDGTTGTFPNEAEWTGHRISKEGIRVLAKWLTKAGEL